MTSPTHELVEVLLAHDLALNGTLVEMLNEHFTHRTERRGCGYTQATRHLAVLVNQARPGRHDIIEKLFPHYRGRVSGEASEHGLRRAIEAVEPELQREESRLLTRLLADLVDPSTDTHTPLSVAAFAGEIKIGTCPLAEKYFLELADGFVRRKGRANVLVSAEGAPLLVEKVNLGDSHSCVNVAPLRLNGVRLPPGCLLGVHYDYDGDAQARPNRVLPGSIVGVDRCGFRLLRFTTLVVSPANRPRAFSTHFQAQLDAGLFAPGTATIDDLRHVAEAQL